LVTERAFADHRRTRDLARAGAIISRTAAIVRAPPELDQAMLAIARRYATDPHSEILNRRGGAAAAMAALW
jgi:hypothetical protein